MTASVLAITARTLVDHQWIKALPSFFYTTLIFLIFGTGLIFMYLYRSGKAGFFVQLYLLTMVVKFIAYGIYNFIVILEDKAGAASNVIWFLILYVSFTALEIGFLYGKISRS
jgi:hypothetical protein